MSKPSENSEIVTATGNVAADVSSNRTFTISYNESLEGKYAMYAWQTKTLTQEAFCLLIAQHKVRADKDGPAFVPGRMEGSRRDANKLKTIEFFVADIDGDMPWEQAKQICDDSGYHYVMATSHNHLSISSEIKTNDLSNWAKKNNISTVQLTEHATLSAYLESMGRLHIIGEFQLASTMPTENDAGKAVLTINHKPIEKFRIYFPFERPYVLAENGFAFENDEFTWRVAFTTQERKEAWQEGMHPALMKGLGLPGDRACKDVARVYYLPSHPPGIESQFDVEWGPRRMMLDYDDFRDAARDELIAYSQPKSKKKPAKVATKLSSKTVATTASTSEPSTELKVFAAKYGKTFKFASMLKSKRDDEGADWIGEDREKGGVFLECAFEDEHSEASPQRTWADDPDDEAGHGFGIFCSGNACVDRKDRLIHLQKLLVDEKLDWSDLQDEAFGGGPVETRQRQSKTPSKVSSKDAVAALKKRIGDEPAFALAACLHVFALQDAEEQQSSVTDKKNGVGFGTHDAELLSVIAKTWINEKIITSKHRALVCKRMQKYHGQLIDVGGGVVPEIEEAAREISDVIGDPPETIFAQMYLEALATNRVLLLAGDDDPVAQAAICADKLVERNTESPSVFNMGGKLFRVLSDEDTGRAVVRELNNNELQDDIGMHAAIWLRDTTLGYKTITTPATMAGFVRSRMITRVPKLERIADTPFYDGEWNLVATPGYHHASRTYYAPRHDLNVMLPPPSPTSEEVALAVGILREPFIDMPFDDDAGLAHTLAMIVQQIVRTAIKGPTPAYLIHKPAAGTGSGLLMDAVSLIASGRPAPIETEKSTDEEWRKMYTAALLGGSSMLVIDNVHREITGAATAAFITSEVWSDRVLGASAKVEMPNKTLLAFTGNNPTWSKEMDRRLLPIRLDAKAADPTRGRKFKHPRLKEWVIENRSTIVSCVFVLVQAWLVAGKPYRGSYLASFESYSEIVGGVLENAGVSGFLSNFEVRENDDPLQSFIEAYYDVFSTEAVKVGKLSYNQEPSALQYGKGECRTLAELLLNPQYDFDFWFVGKESKERWGARLGEQLTGAKDRVFALPSGREVRLEKLPRSKFGIRYKLAVTKERQRRSVKWYVEQLKRAVGAYSDADIDPPRADDAGEGGEERLVEPSPTAVL